MTSSRRVPRARVSIAARDESKPKDEEGYEASETDPGRRAERAASRRVEPFSVTLA